ncbi:MAG TPA: PAS domain S-box protein [Rubrobacteraceae bacterium]|nr:PAS domain S-box protein [Rubrobacteraceae bacterium]
MSERKRAEEELKQSEEWFRSLVQNVSDVITVVDAAGAARYVSPAVERVLGYRPEEMIGKSAFDFVHPDNLEEALSIFANVLSEPGMHAPFEFPVPHKDGSWRYLEHVVTNLLDDPSVRGIVINQRDITERKKAESTLRESEERFRATFEQAAVGIAHVDPNGRWLRVNQKLCDMVGYTREELLELTYQDITYPDDLDADIEYVRQLLADEIQTRSMEKRYFRKDGSIVWVNLTVSLVHEPSGEPKYFIAVIEDIDKRKHAEEASQASHKGLADIKFALDESTIVAFTDQRGKITYVNDKFCEISKYAKEELLGQDHRIINSGYHSKEYIRNLWRTIARGSVWRGELRNRAKDGSIYWVDTTIVPFLDEGGNPYQYVAIRHDITPLKAAEEEIETRAAQQSAVVGLGMRALSEDDLQAVMDETVGVVCRILNTDYCKVLELIPGGNALLLRAGVGWKKELVGKATVGAGLDSQAGYTLLSTEPVIVEDLRTEGRFSGPPLLHEHGVVSGMSVVIQGRDGPFGVLGAHAKSSRPFTDDDVNFLQAVANVLAAAVEWRTAEEALIEVREAERSRIARDMHDDALQHIVYALQEIGMRWQAPSGDGAQGDAGLEEAAKALRRSVSGLRAAIFDLPLVGGDADGDFLEQLETLVRLNRQSSSDRKIELFIEGNLPRPLGKRTRVELLRILQEALANVRRHSEASRVWVTAGASGGKLWAEVKDDGRGFGPETLAGMGTRGMRERARILGGGLTIESGLGKGTKVRFEAPFRGEGHKKPEEEEVRLLLVEDHASFREAAASVFEREPGFEVVGQAGSLAEARKVLADGSAAEVAIVDLGLPDGYGGDLIKDVRLRNPKAQALVLSASLERMEIARAVESGAAGVLHKSAGLDEVLDAVRRLRRGETLLPVEEAVELLSFASSSRKQEHEAHQAIASLTPRERELLEALAEGLDGKGIAERLGISTVTERNHVANILTKLGVHSRLQALLFALRHGIVDLR